MKKYFSVVSLLIANIIPLFGVLFWGWHVFPILLTYWLENVALGFWNVIKMSRCSMDGNLANASSKQALIGFFIIHYGIFTIAHGSFVFMLFGSVSSGSINFLEILFAFVVILTSHGVSYFYNFVGRNEFALTTVAEQMFKPYVRVVIMHVVIIFGAMFVVNLSGQSIFPLVILVGLKTVIDLFSHLFEHKVTKEDYNMIRNDEKTPASSSLNSLS